MEKLILSIENINESFRKRVIYGNFLLKLDARKIYILMSANNSGKTIQFFIFVYSYMLIVFGLFPKNHYVNEAPAVIKN